MTADTMHAKIVRNKIAGRAGLTEVVVPRHTQYLSLHLGKTMFIPEKFGVMYLGARPIFSSSLGPGECKKLFLRLLSST